MISVRGFKCVGALALCLLLWSGAARSQAPAPVKQTDQVAMGDGVRLATDVYLPPGPGPFPVTLMRTPYNKAAGTAAGADAARRGYALVIQDTRGRFASEGENLPFDGDGWAKHRDGYDTVEWIAAQPWCNGKIGTFGGSALGITQLKLAGTGTKRVAAQVIHVACPTDYHGMVYTGGVFRKSMIEDWLRGTSHSPEALRIWTSHPSYDDYWRDRDLSTRWVKVSAPAVHAGGWWDIFGQATLDAFTGIQTKGGPAARGRQKLIMGPWTHGIFQDRAGELQFPNGRRPPNDVHDMWKWFDHYLKGIDNGIERAAAVSYFVIGDVTDPQAPGNAWRTADAWPPVKAAETAYYLHPDRTLSPEKHSGDGSLAYVYDPKDPVPTVGGPQLTLPPGPREQRSIEGRKDMLVFTSAPLAEPLEVTGRVRLRLWAASDAPDTDFYGKLCDVYPDGRSINLCEGILRARFREGFQRERLLTPGKATRLDVDLWSTSVVFNKGHRLRLHVTSSCAPGYDPNPNTGEPFRASERTQPARNTVFMSGKSPSQLLLPIVTAKSQAMGR